MYRQTSQQCFGRALVDAMLAALNARPAAALLTTPTAVLFTAGPSMTPDVTVAAFTLATFHGYASVALTFSGAVNIDPATQGVTGTAVFTATAGGTIPPNPILGYLVTDGAAAFYAGEFFQTPVPIAFVGDFLQVDIVLPLPMQVAIAP